MEKTTDKKIHLLIMIGGKPLKYDFNIKSKLSYCLIDLLSYVI